MEKLSRLIEQIYSAALEPSLWPAAVDSMQSHFGCSAAGLYVQDLPHQRVELVHMTGVDEDYVKSYRQRYLVDNPWHDSSLQIPGALRTEKTLDSHFKRPGFYHRTALFNEWMKPQDFIYTLGMNLTADRLQRTKLFLYRSGRSTAFGSRDIDQFGCLARHLTTAIKVTRRLGQQASQDGQMLDLLERMDVGAAILDEQGFVIEANPVARTLFAAKDVLTVADGVINAVQLGRNVVGGAVSLHTREPGFDHQGYARLSLGNYGEQRLEAAGDLPLNSSNVALRLAGLSVRRNGFTRNIFLDRDMDDAHHDAYRASLLYTPADNLKLVVSSERRAENSTRGLGLQPAADIGRNGGIELGGVVPQNPREVTGNVIPKIHIRSRRDSARLSWHRPAFDLLATSAYVSSNAALALDLDGTNAAYAATSRARTRRC